MASLVGWLPLLAAMAPSLPPLAEREAGVRQVVGSLYGAPSSKSTVSRDVLAQKEVEGRFGPTDRKDLTYGEFDIDFFFEMLRVVEPREGEAFIDIGSGCGRLVIAAALLHRWRLSCGIELLDSLHEMATGDLDRLHAALESDPLLSLAPCLLAHGEAVNLLPQVMSIPSDWEEQRSVAFVYATCWPGTASELPALSETLASCLAEGSRVITIDKQLVSSTIGEWAWVPLCAPIERPNRDTHTSLGYAYELKRCAAAAAVAADEERRRGMLN